MDDDTNAEGIPLRDYFAGQYMAAAFEKALTMSDAKLGVMFGQCTGITREQVGAALAYQYADAMIARRNRKSDR